MSLRYTNFSLSIPVDLHKDLKEYSEVNMRTMTGVILETLRWRLKAEKGGKPHCVTGEPCALALLQPGFLGHGLPAPPRPGGG
jgi:hypothetical protein